MLLVAALVDIVLFLKRVFLNLLNHTSRARVSKRELLDRVNFSEIVIGIIGPSARVPPGGRCGPAYHSAQWDSNTVRSPYVKEV